MRERTVDTNGCGGTQACINDQTLVRHRPKRVNRHSNPLADIVIVRIVSPQRGCRKTGARCQREVEGGRYDKYLACMGGGGCSYCAFRRWIPTRRFMGVPQLERSMDELLVGCSWQVSCFAVAGLAARILTLALYMKKTARQDKCTLRTRAFAPTQTPMAQVLSSSESLQHHPVRWTRHRW